jgi:hypothetical protein
MADVKEMWDPRFEGVVASLISSVDATSDVGASTGSLGEG